MKALLRSLFRRSLMPCGAALFLLSGCDSGPRNAGTDRHRLIFNNDGTCVLYFNAVFQQHPLTKADVEAYVDQMVKGTQVTTVMMCTGSDFTYYRSKYGRPFGDSRGGQLGCENAAVLKLWNRYYQSFLSLEAEGTDQIETTLLRAQELGKEAFITYRMNDLHFADTTDCCPIERSDFWMEHPEYWLGDSTQGWHSGGALDFTISEVRRRKLDLITEQLEKYEMIDGFELDFMRFAVFFRTGEGPRNAHLMTRLVEEVRARIDSVSAVRGKEILLAVRVPFTLDGCIQKGLDVKKWADLGLIDFVTISGHWKGETAMPVEQFRKEFGHPEIPLYAALDDGGYAQREFFSHGMIRGMASHCLSQGADGLYLLNYYAGLPARLEPEPGGQACRVMAPSLLMNEIGRSETLRGRNKIYCESDGQTDTYRILQVGSLPLAVSENRMAFARIYIGDDLEENLPEEMILFVRTDRPARFRVWINETPVTEQRPDYPALYDRERGEVENDQTYAFGIPAGALRQGYNEVSFLSDAPLIFVVRRLEAALRYGPVETHGYF